MNKCEIVFFKQKEIPKKDISVCKCISTLQEADEMDQALEKQDSQKNTVPQQFSIKQTEVIVQTSLGPMWRLE